jgi:hypothetical protein
MKFTLHSLQLEKIDLSIEIEDLKDELKRANIPADKLLTVPGLVRKQMRLDDIRKRIVTATIEVDSLYEWQKIPVYAGELK